MNEVLERRAVPQPVTLRAAPESSTSPGILEGYALEFNKLSRDLGGWFEEIDPRAFGEPIDGALDMSLHHRVLCRSEHDSRLLLGTTDAGTLRIFIDDVGLRYEVDLPNTTAGRDAAALAERGDYAFSSFAFYTLPDGTRWREDEDGRLVRRVTAGRLVDTAPVADPAYWSSSVGKRDFDLDEVRASLHSETSLPAPPGEYENAATDRARAKETPRAIPPFGNRSRKTRGKELHDGIRR